MLSLLVGWKMEREEQVTGNNGHGEKSNKWLVLVWVVRVAVNVCDCGRHDGSLSFTILSVSPSKSPQLGNCCRCTVPTPSLVLSVLRTKKTNCFFFCPRCFVFAGNLLHSNWWARKRGEKMFSVCYEGISIPQVTMIFYNYMLAGDGCC